MTVTVVPLPSSTAVMVKFVATSVTGVNVVESSVVHSNEKAAAAVVAKVIEVSKNTRIPCIPST